MEPLNKVGESAGLVGEGEKYVSIVDGLVVSINIVEHIRPYSEGCNPSDVGKASC